MSDDLDDGEILPKELISSTRVAPSSKRGDRVDRREPASGPSRGRYSDERDSSRNRRRSPVDCGPYYRSERRSRSRDVGRWRQASPRGYDRHPLESSGSRTKALMNRKQPSVHDANTRADLGRLAREAEAAAYKARNAALVKTAQEDQSSSPVPAKTGDSSPRARSRSVAASSGPAPRRRSMSPNRSKVPLSRSDENTDQATRSTSTTSSKGRHSPVEVRERGTSGDTSKLPMRPSRKSLTVADVGRLQREKEAAAYKARVQAEAQKSRPLSKAEDGSQSGRSQPEHQSRQISEAAEKSKSKTTSQSSTREAVRHVVSFTPALDTQVLALKEESERLILADLNLQALARASHAEWTKLEQAARREEYRSELAQQSLESIAAV